jgi:hypothetical protein
LHSRERSIEVPQRTVKMTAGCPGSESFSRAVRELPEGRFAVVALAQG